jgi:hypothetical protein
MKDVRGRVSSVCASVQQRSSGSADAAKNTNSCEKTFDGVHNRKDIDVHQDPGNHGAQRVSLSMAFVLYFKLPIRSLGNF